MFETNAKRYGKNNKIYFVNEKINVNDRIKK